MRILSRLALGFTTALLAAAPATAQYATSTRTPLVLQIGDGTVTVGSSGYTSTVKQYDFNVANQAAPLSAISFANGASSTNRLVNSASASSEGSLTNSADGAFAVLGGYDAANATANVNSTAANANRVVGFAAVGSSGLTSVATAYSNTQATTFNNNNFRSAVSLAGPTSNAWTAGTGGTASTAGVRFAGTNTQVSASVTNVRNVDIYGSQLFAGTGSGAFVGVNSVGSGLPTTSGNTITNLIATGGSPYEFVGFTDPGTTSANLPAAAAGNNRFYVADDTASTAGGIKRYSWNGTTFNLDYTINPGVGSTAGARGLAGFSQSPSALGATSILYATNAAGTQLFQITDPGTKALAEGSFTVLATADANTVFRGVALAPTFVVPEPSLLLIAGAIAVGLRRRFA